jgi:hypothetical protein
MRPRKGNYCYLCYPCRSQHMFGQQTESRPPKGPEGCHRHLRVEWLALPILPAAPPGGPPSTFFCVDGGLSRFCQQHPLGGPLLTFFALMVGAPDLRHRIPGGPPSIFFALMVGAPESPAPPSRGPSVDIFCVYGGRSRISGTASQRVHRQHFLR